MKIRSLTGPERLKVFTNISIADLLPTFSPSKCLAIQGLWVDLLQLNRTFSKRPDEVTPEDVSKFASDSKAWVRRFLDIYHENNVTPYIHAMANHVHEFMTMHGSILPFTQQGLEKYNDVMTKEFFRATCHRNEDALIQIIQKQNRLEHLRLKNVLKFNAQIAKKLDTILLPAQSHARIVILPHAKLTSCKETDIK